MTIQEYVSREKQEGLTRFKLQQLFLYDAEGFLVNKESRGPRAKKGERVGLVKSGKYGRVSIKGKSYLAHRLIFMWHWGFCPQIVDHKDGNPSNNQIKNLRESTFALNIANTGPLEGGASQYKGVTKPTGSSANPWVASIRKDGKNYRLGVFPTEEEAALCYDSKAYEFWQDHAYLNFPDQLSNKEVA